MCSIHVGLFATWSLCSREFWKIIPVETGWQKQQSYPSGNSFSLLEEIWTYLKPDQQKEETRGGQYHLPAHLSGTQISGFEEVKKKEEEEKPQCKKEREMKKAEEEHTKNVKSNLSSDPRREAEDHYLPHLHPHHPCLTQTTMSVTQSARPVIPTEHWTGWLVTCALPGSTRRVLIFLLKVLWEKGLGIVTVDRHACTTQVTLGCGQCCHVSSMWPPEANWHQLLLLPWYKVAVPWLLGVVCCFMYSLWLGLHKTALRVQIPYTLE